MYNFASTVDFCKENFLAPTLFADQGKKPQILKPAKIISLVHSVQLPTIPFGLIRTALVSFSEQNFEARTGTVKSVMGVYASYLNGQSIYIREYVRTDLISFLFLNLSCCS